MATFNAKAFEKKLNGMDLSQTSVQTVSLWIIHHKHNIKEVLGVWVDMMKKAKIDRKLVLFYLANDVVQNSRKKSKDFVMFFGKAFKETISHLNDKKVNSQVERVLKIWEERRVYEKEFVEKLRALHSGGKKEKSSKPPESRKEEKIVEKPEKPSKPKTPVKPLPPDFKMSTVMNMIVSMKEVESEISTHDSQMASLKVDASDLEAVKQVKDRSGVNRFVKEFEDSNEKLDAYCNTLSRCINDKRVLIDMLHHSENYYDAAYEEAKVIVHAYKTFGSRLTSMKRKVESKVKKLKTKWEKEQKEIEEQKNTKHEYELEPISDPDEPSEFQPIGDLLQSGLKSLAEKKKDEMYRPEDPTVDKLDVLDMDLGSDSDGGTPDGPLYDPSSVLYDPIDPGKDSVDGSQQSLENSDGQNSSNINIPNPEDVLKNIVGQNEMPIPLQPMGIMIDGKLQTFSLADGDAIAGISTNTNLMQLSTSSTRSKKKSNTAVKEASGSFLNNEAMSPISEDSVPSPEGTPEDLVLEKDQSQNDSLPNQLETQQQIHTANLLQSAQVLPSILSDGQMMIGDQLVTLGQDNWALLANQAPIQLDSLQGFQPAGIQDMPPPPVLQGFPNLLNPGQQLSFDPQTQAFLNDQAAMGNPLGQLAQTQNLLGQLGMQIGGLQAGGIPLGQPGMTMQLPVSEVLPQVSVGASTTPTLDESLDKSVRPIDILSQLLSKGGKSKKGSSERDKSHSGDKDKEHRSRDHGKHRRSSTSKRRSVDRHHSSEHREGSSERHESSHSSSKKSHHRKKSRGRSKEKRSHSSEKSDTQRQFSVDSYDDASVDSYMKSPKVSRLQSLTESFEDAAESMQEAGEEDRSKPNNAESTKDEDTDKPITLFDQRRKSKAEQTNQAHESQSQAQRSDSVATDAPEGVVSKGNAEIVQQDANMQFAAQNNVFLQQQQQSFEGQQILSSQFNQQMLNPAMNIPNTQQWTPTPEGNMQNQQGFIFDSLRSPTPEMDQFKNITQNQQTHIIDPTFQQSGQFSHMQLQQQGMQPGGLTGMPLITSQGSLTISPNIPVSVDMRPAFPPSFQADQSREQNIEQGGFTGQQIVEQSQMMQGEHLQMQVNPQVNQHAMQAERHQSTQEQDQINPGKGLLPSPQQSPIEPRLRMPAPTGSGRFRPVEAQMVSNLRFLRPQQDSPEQSSMTPPLWHDSQSPRQESPIHRPERPPFRPSQPGLLHQRQERPPFHPQRNPVSPFGLNFQPDFERQDMSKPSITRQLSREVPDTEINQNFDSRPGQNVEQGHRLPSRSPMPQDRNDRFHNFEQDVADYSLDGATDFSEGSKPNFTNTNLTVIKTIDNEDHSINGEFEGQERQEEFQETQQNQKNIRPLIPRGGLMRPQRHRFRHHEPNTFHRGPRPFRMGRPTGFRPTGFQQHEQRHRFRPPLRPRMPRGFAPRRPVF